MGTRSMVVSACVVATAGLLFAAGPVAGQEGGGRTASGKSWSPPRTPDGQPDMQGFYSHVGFGMGKEDRPAVLCPPGATGSNGCYQSEWGNDTTRGQLKMKLPMDIIEPADGRLPLQPWARDLKEEYKRKQEDPEKLQHIDTQTRCLHSGVPRSNWAIGYVGYQIVQGPGYVALYTEYNHEYRFIPLDRREHLTPNIRLFGGDSIGRWEGNTLIVETTNIAVPKTTGFGLLDLQGTPFSDALKVVERYTLMDPNTIAVEVTLDDPKMYTRPWKTAGAFIRGSKDYQVFEFACHEGNLGMENLSFRVPKKK